MGQRPHRFLSLQFSNACALENKNTSVRETHPPNIHSCFLAWQDHLERDPCSLLKFNFPTLDSNVILASFSIFSLLTLLGAIFFLLIISTSFHLTNTFFIVVGACVWAFKHLVQTKHSAAVWALLVSVVLGPSYFHLQNGLYFDTMGLSYGIAKATSLTRLFKSGPHQGDKCPILASLLLWQSN